jgi:hypothetical protein
MVRAKSLGRRRRMAEWIAIGVLALCVAGLWAYASTRAPRSALDKLEIIELAHRYAQGVDRLDRDLLATAFAADAVAHYKVVGEAPYELDEHLDGFDAIYGWLSAALSHRGDATPWHFMSTPIVELDGDEARMRVFMHNRPLDGVGVYTMDAERTSAGWRIRKLQLEERALGHHEAGGSA